MPPWPPAKAAQSAETNSTLAYGPALPSKSSNEYLMRSRSTKVAQNAPAAAVESAVSAIDGEPEPAQAVWIGRALVLARRVRVEEGTFFQGCWLDWDVIRRDLVEGSNDLVPNASLEMAPVLSGPVPTRMLASLPVRLVPGRSRTSPSPGGPPPASRWRSPGRALRSPPRRSHCCSTGHSRSSERRGTFVSAVTHELRTPLTTFRLYTEMLDEGMVAGADSQRAYFKTLRGEADRLGHLVENVLAFAKLERGRAVDGREIVSPAELLDRLVPRLGRARLPGRHGTRRRPG